MSDHLRGLLDRRPELAPCAADIRAAFALLVDVFAAGGKALFCGNGGSSSDADHWAGELLKGFETRRALSPSARAALPAELADTLCGGLPVVPLHSFTAFASAFANDCTPRAAHAQLVWILGNPGDAFVALSTSGTSANVVLAMEAARAKGMRTLALTGAGGGTLATKAEVCIRVPESRTCLAQELHVAVYHALSLMLEDHFFPDSDRD